MKIEAIPNFAAGIYSLIADKSPFIKDVYKSVAEDVCSRMSRGKILDVGTGPGYLPVEIGRKSAAFELAGIDLSPRMVEIATRNAKKAGLSERVRFELSAAAKMPFEDESFDFVVSTLSFHHWRDPRACFSEIHRVLKKNGTFHIYDIWRDTPKEAEAGVRATYGPFVSFLILKLVRLHSSITLKTAEDTLAGAGGIFSQKRIEPQGILLRFELVK